MSTVLIASIKVGQRFRKDLGDINCLAASINEVGLLHPVVINENKELIAGLRRLEACKKLGWTEIPVHVVNRGELRKGEFHENAVRKGFTASELVAVKRALEPQIKETRIGHRLSKDAQKKLVHCTTFPKGPTKQIVANFAGVSDATLTRAETIVEAAEDKPEKYGKLLERVDNGKISINAACVQIKRAERHENPPTMPDGEFDVIYADPPWKYEFCLEGDPQEYYTTREITEICELIVPAAKNAVLFLWATNPKLEDALTVAKAWGFQYITNIVWVKQTLGLGYYSMAQHELLLICKRGDVPPPQAESRPSSVIHADRKEHSRKPPIFYEIIEKMYPNRKYLELYSRNERDGWTTWGDQVNG